MAKKSISNTACFSVKPHHPLCRIDEVKRVFWSSISLADTRNPSTKPQEEESFPELYSDCKQLNIKGGKKEMQVCVSYSGKELGFPS